MALSISGGGGGATSVVSHGPSGTVTTVAAIGIGDIVIVIAYNEQNGAGTSVAAGGISSPHLASASWHKRYTSPFISASPAGCIEIWWAYNGTGSAIALGEVITVNWGAAFDDGILLEWSVGGFTGGTYSTNPWDSFGTIYNAASSSSQPTISGMGSSGSAGMLINVCGAITNTVGVGTFTGTPQPLAALGTTINSFAAVAQAQYQVYSTTQSGVSTNWSQPNPNTNWQMVGDALNISGGAAAGGPPTRTMMGVGISAKIIRPPKPKLWGI
jgi:hypothetical protein